MTLDLAKFECLNDKPGFVTLSEAEFQSMQALAQQ
jgi:hypothetical protein